MSMIGYTIHVGDWHQVDRACLACAEEALLARGHVYVGNTAELGLIARGSGGAYNRAWIGRGD